MKHKITPCLWFNQQAEEAAALYVNAFRQAKISSRSPMVVEMDISGHTFILLDGGPQFQPNPSISFFYICESPEELEQAWSALAGEGKIMMPLDNYPWSEKYGWVSDRFGISWQISLGKISDVGQKITPCLLFTRQMFGRAEEAINFYASVFENSSVDGILRWDEAEGKELAGKVKHAQMALDGNKLMLMESLGHDFGFSEGVSLTVYCDTQEEVDYYWDRLTGEGGKESMCGWLADKFGVWWQITPEVLVRLMKDPDKAGKAMKAFLPMKKLNIAEIVSAANA
jgi:predicted 3-demethylubiquinone-9 3-methyltransferase (glyoxalase superfamily)